MDNTIALNWDNDAEYFFIKNLDDMENLQTKAIEYFDKYYNNPGISDIMFEIFGQTSITESEVFTTRNAKYLMKTENGIAVDYTNNDYLSKIYECQKKRGVYLTELWIKRCVELGKRPWISLRMNDNHYRDDDTCFIRSDFFYTALENGWMLGDKQTYRSGYRNFNYAVPEVQDIMLRYIKEQLSKTDVHGIQLDFSREPKCLRYFDDQNVCGYMTDFIRNVHKIVVDCEKIHNHKIKLAVMLVRDINLAKKIGFDVVTWAKESLVDVLIPNSHWLGCDTGMPIDEWCSAVCKYGVDVYAGMEMNMPYRLPVDFEVAKGFDFQTKAKGSKKTVIYNLYHIYLKNSKAWDRPLTEKDITDVWLQCAETTGVRRHILTQEMFGFDDIKPRWQPLPIIINGEVTLSVDTGEITQNSKSTVYIGVKSKDAKNISVFYNGIACEYNSNDKNAHILKNQTIDAKDILAFEVSNPTSDLISQSVTVSTSENLELFYVEIKIFY